MEHQPSEAPLENEDEFEDIRAALAEDPPEPSRLNRFLQRALRWAAGLGAVFVLGIALTWFVQVQPRAEEIDALRSELEQANGRISALEKQVGELQAVAAENADLQAALLESELHLDLLSVLLDVNTAQLALAQENSEVAQATLAETDLKLSLLQDGLSANHAQTVDRMRERLLLAFSEIDNDIFAAQSDLDVLHNSLLALERSLFGE